MLVVWDLKWSCWQFSFTVGHCGAGRFCSEPQSWAWRLRVLPYVGPHRCQQQMCWTTRLRPWTPCLGRGCVHGLLAGVKKYAVNKKKTTKSCVLKYECLCVSTILSTCLFVCPMSDWEHISSPCFSSARTHMHTHISLNIHGEHPRLQWVTPGYASSLSPLSLYSPVPTPAASGTYWRQSHTEP